MRHNPVLVTEEIIFLSLSLPKRMEIMWSDIEEDIDEPQHLKRKHRKNTIQFIARDFEHVYPDLIL